MSSTYFPPPINHHLNICYTHSFPIYSDSLGASTKLILLNAIYFKGNWLKAFDSAKTRVRPFYVSPNHKPIPTKMMASRNYFRTAFIKEANLRALELPYSVIYLKYN